MSRSAYERKSLWFTAGLFAAMALAMLIVASLAIFQRPRTYRSLSDHGVLTLARFHCDRDDCDLTYTYAGRRHTNRYSNDRDQFSHWPPRTLVLVDPRDPGTMFTVHDVQHGTNAGLGVHSVLAILIGLLFAGMAAVVLRFLRILPRRPPPPEPPRWDASPAARTLYATDQVQELLEWAHALPGSRWYRVEPGEIARRVEAMRSSIAQLPGPRAQARDAANRVAREVGAAPRIPVLGGVRVRAPALSDELDQVRLGVLAAITAPPVDSARRD